MRVLVLGAGFECKKFVVNDSLWDTGPFGIGVVEFDGVKYFGGMTKSNGENSVRIINAVNRFKYRIRSKVADHSPCVGVWAEGIYC